MKKSFNIKITVAIVLSLLFWGSAFPAIRAALVTYSPGHLALFRLMIASTVLLAWACARGIKRPMAKDIPAILMLGITGILSVSGSLIALGGVVIVNRGQVAALENVNPETA